MKAGIVLKINKLFRRFNGLVILNISGLALGLASVIFIAIWCSHELSYDIPISVFSQQTLFQVIVPYC